MLHEKNDKQKNYFNKLNKELNIEKGGTSTEKNQENKVEISPSSPSDNLFNSILNVLGNRKLFLIGFILFILLLVALTQFDLQIDSYLEILFFIPISIMVISLQHEKKLIFIKSVALLISIIIILTLALTTNRLSGDNIFKIFLYSSFTILFPFIKYIRAL